MAELFYRDILQHVADADVIAMERLDKVLECRGQFPSRSAKLFEQVLSETWVGRLNLHGTEQFFL